MTLVAPRILNSVSCVTRINHEIHFSWLPPHAPVEVDGHDLIQFIQMIMVHQCMMMLSFQMRM